MNARASTPVRLAALALVASTLAGLACRHASTSPTNNNTPAPPCDPPASTLIRDGLWQRTEVFGSHPPDFSCAAPATYVDTLLWVGVDFMSALTDSQITCAPQWSCDSRFTIACIDTIDDVGCRYIITAQGNGTFREDSLSGTLLVRARTSGACGTIACASNLRLSAVWIGPAPGPRSYAAQSGPPRSGQRAPWWSLIAR
jgi:hypothetical protein